MDHQFVVMNVSCHFPTVHDKVALRTAESFIFFKIWGFEFCRNSYARNKTHVHNIETKQILSFDGFEPLLKYLMLLMGFFSLVSLFVRSKLIVHGEIIFKRVLSHGVNNWLLFNDHWHLQGLLV